MGKQKENCIIGFREETTKCLLANYFRRCDDEKLRLWNLLTHFFI